MNPPVIASDICSRAGVDSITIAMAGTCVAFNADPSYFTLTINGVHTDAPVPAAMLFCSFIKVIADAVGESE